MCVATWLHLRGGYIDGYLWYHEGRRDGHGSSEGCRTQLSSAILSPPVRPGPAPQNIVAVPPLPGPYGSRGPNVEPALDPRQERLRRPARVQRPPHARAHGGGRPARRGGRDPPGRR